VAQGLFQGIDENVTSPAPAHPVDREKGGDKTPLIGCHKRPDHSFVTSFPLPDDNGLLTIPPAARSSG
jgi:hypothetical protein